MEIIDKKLFIKEYAELLRTKEFNDLLEELKTKSIVKRKGVFNSYTPIQGGHLIENQIYNEKNAMVEVLTIMLETKDKFELIKLDGIKHIVAELNERIEEHKGMIENTIGGLSNGITMSVYTETDIILRGAKALDDILAFYEKAFDGCKNETEDDKTLTDVIES